MRYDRKTSSLHVWPANASGPAAPSPAPFAGRGNRRSGARFSRREAGVRCAPLLCGPSPRCGTGLQLLFSKLNSSIRLRRLTATHLMKVARPACLFRQTLHLSRAVLLALPFGRGGDASAFFDAPPLGFRRARFFRPSRLKAQAAYSQPLPYFCANLPRVIVAAKLEHFLASRARPFDLAARRRSIHEIANSAPPVLLIPRHRSDLAAGVCRSSNRP